MNDNSSRYYIYEMLDNSVRCCLGMEGTVGYVSRDILENKIAIKFDGSMHFFNEPDSIRFDREHKAIVFTYGLNRAFDDGDDALFDEMREGFGENIDQVINKNPSKTTREVIFNIIDG